MRSQRQGGAEKRLTRRRVAGPARRCTTALQLCRGVESGLGVQVWIRGGVVEASSEEAITLIEGGVSGLRGKQALDWLRGDPALLAR